MDNISQRTMIGMSQENNRVSGYVVCEESRT